MKLSCTQSLRLRHLKAMIYFPPPASKQSANQFWRNPIVFFNLRGTSGNLQVTVVRDQSRNCIVGIRRGKAEHEMGRLIAHRAQANALCVAGNKADISCRLKADHHVLA